MIFASKLNNTQFRGENKGVMFMSSESKKRKCKNTYYDRGGEKGKIHRLKGYAMYHKKDRVANNKAIKEQESENE